MKAEERAKALTEQWYRDINQEALMSFDPQYLKGLEVRDHVSKVCADHMEKLLTEAIRQAEAAARKEEREADCKAVCIYCERGDQLIYGETSVAKWHHPHPAAKGKFVTCDAHAIRARALPLVEKGAVP